MLSRRRFLSATAGAVTLAAAQQGMPGIPRSPVQAIAFDAFPIFDPRPVAALAGKIFPGKGVELTNAWRTRQFEYTWLRTLTGHYADFWQVTGDALNFAARSAKLELSPQSRSRLMNAYLDLPAWPDAPAALQRLKSSGIRLALLSNFTRGMLAAALKNSGLEDAFEHVLSTDAVKRFKPAPEAYRMAVDAFRMKRDQVLFAAFAGWDAAGAKEFGFRTAWVNRMDAPLEELSVAPDVVCRDLAGLVDFAAALR